MKKYYYEFPFSETDACKKTISRYLRQHLEEIDSASDKTRIYFIDCSASVMMYVSFNPNVVFFIERNPNDMSLRFKRIRLHD